MNVFGQRERSWRKARKRAVSPIIATILLVAITVVLAAVLYVLISGLTHGPGSTPIGSAFSAGNPVSSNSYGSSAAASTCPASAALTAASTTASEIKSGDYTYTLTVESSTITFASALFEVKSATGSVLTATGGAGFYIMTVGGITAACTSVGSGGALAMTATFASYNGIATVCNGGTTSCTTSTSLTSIYTIVIDMGTANPTGTGLSFVAVGTGSYSGTTSPLSLP
jgi:archaeal type IV pilus assembly protein PilA